MPTETFEPRTEPGPEQPDSNATVDQTFPVGDQCRLVIENPRGQIRVTGWDQPEVRLRATKLLDGSSLARFNATRIETSQDGSSVVARTLLDGNAPFRGRDLWDDLVSDAFRSFADLIRNTALPAEVVYEVQVPRHADLDLRGVTSQIVVEGVRGAVRANNVSGLERLERVQGDLVLSTVSGCIDGREVDGYLDARAVSGSVRVAGRLDVVKVNTVSGSMELASPLAPSGSFDLHTVSGSVTLRLPADTSASITARGVSTAVTSDLPCQVTSDRRTPGSRRWEGRLNGGAATIQFNTVSGHLYLTYPAGPTASPAIVESSPPAATESAAAAPDAAPPTSPESDQLRILQALERGELAVDDALKQLEDLRG